VIAEYQHAVELYEQAEGLGKVSRNIMRPDKITGQPRQIDTWRCQIPQHESGR